MGVVKAILILTIKDITFNKLQVAFGALLVLLSSLFILGGQEYVIIPFIMAPSLLFLMTVSKGCYLDDKNNVDVFLRALPIPKSAIVLSKYAESILVLILSYVIIFGCNLILLFFAQPLYRLDVSLLLVISIILTYYAVFLWLYYKYDYASTHNASFVIVLAWIGVFKLQQYLSGSGFVLTRIIRANILYLLFFVAIGIFVISCKLSTNAFMSKDL
jgi:hypothetical protein